MEQFALRRVLTVMRPRFAALFLAAACAAPQPPPPRLAAAPHASIPETPPRTPPGKARVDLAVRKSTFFLGENVLVDYCVVNTSPAPFSIDVGGDYRGSSRSLRFKVEARDSHGVLQPDPDPHPTNFGGMSYSPEIAPGGRWCQSLPLLRYARIDAPGTYTVTVTHDLGWKGEKAPTGTVTLTLAMPSPAQAEHVVAAMEALKPDPDTSAGNVSADYPDFSGLRYEVYVAPLVARAKKGDLHAFEGLTNVPTEAATRALVALLALPDHAASQAAAQALAMRLPDPALHGALGPRNVFENAYADQRRYLARAWVPSLAGDVRAAARARLGSSDPNDAIDGAFMLEALGTPADGPALVQALDAAIDRTRTQPPETNIYPPPRGACQELLRAADVLVGRKLAPPAHPKTAGEVALWLVALPHASPRPPGWQAELGRAMRHPIAYVRKLALDYVPSGALSAALLPAVAADLKDADADVVVAAAQLAEREHARTLGLALVAAMPKQKGLRLDVVSNAAYSLGARRERARMLLSLLGSDAAFHEAMSELVDMLQASGRSTSGEPSKAERAALAKRWAAFLAKHTKEIEAGTTIPLSDPTVTKDLLPSGWKLDRKDGTSWP
jgi:hypothetical protein